MTADHVITHACGHDSTHTIKWDGRRKLVDFLPASGETVCNPVTPRREAELLCERTYPPTEVCIRCFVAARRAIWSPLLGPDCYLPCLPDVCARAVRRVATITGGHVTMSPKSSSIYVTTPAGAWRISDHSWPGKPESVRSQRQRGQWWCTRLVPDWLAREHATA